MNNNGTNHAPQPQQAASSTSSRYWDVVKWLGMSAALGAGSTLVRKDIRPEQGAIEGAAVGALYLIARGVYQRVA